VFAEQLRAAVEERPFSPAARFAPLRVSAGIASVASSPVVSGPLELSRAAERALAQARASGGNRVFIDPGVLARARRLVVLADDDPSLLDPAEELLALDDFEVVRVESPGALFELLRARRPDLLVVGLQLAQLADPAAWIEQIRGVCDPPFPIIGLAPAHADRPPPAGRARVDRFLTKPFSISLLRHLAREMTALAGARRG
jgi:CheY-like chemotaxis protein